MFLENVVSLKSQMKKIQMDESEFEALFHEFLSPKPINNHKTISLDGEYIKWFFWEHMNYFYSIYTSWIIKCGICK